MTPELLARMDELARKERAGGLTEEELAEQKELQKIYLADMREKAANRFSARKKNFKRKVSSLAQDADEPIELMSSLLEGSD